MPELKPCPFCGQTQKMEESARFQRYGKDEGERIKGYTVVCAPPFVRVWEETISRYGKSWRCWPRKPTPEQMAAEKWEE